MKKDIKSNRTLVYELIKNHQFINQFGNFVSGRYIKHIVPFEKSSDGYRFQCNCGEVTYSFEPITVGMYMGCAHCGDGCLCLLEVKNGRSIFETIKFLQSEYDKLNENIAGKFIDSDIDNIKVIDYSEDPF